MTDIATAVATIKALPAKEQLEVVDRVLADLDASDTAEELTPEIRAELERRLAVHQADPSKALPFEEVSRRAKARWGR
jgi:putative addiction module component (TIGR02574 family)